MAFTIGMRLFFFFVMLVRIGRLGPLHLRGCLRGQSPLLSYFHPPPKKKHIKPDPVVRRHHLDAHLIGPHHGLPVVL
jgi:hypothetical protein